MRRRKFYQKKWEEEKYKDKARAEVFQICGKRTSDLKVINHLKIIRVYLFINLKLKLFF